MKLWNWLRKSETWQLKLSLHQSKQHVAELHKRVNAAVDQILALESVAPPGFKHDTLKILWHRGQYYLAAPTDIFKVPSLAMDPRTNMSMQFALTANGCSKLNTVTSRPAPRNRALGQSGYSVYSDTNKVDFSDWRSHAMVEADELES